MPAGQPGGQIANKGLARDQDVPTVWDRVAVVIEHALIAVEREAILGVPAHAVHGDRALLRRDPGEDVSEGARRVREIEELDGALAGGECR